MATKVKAPLIGAELDPSNPTDSMQNIVLGILGVVLTFGIIAAGQSLYNRFIASPVDSIGKAEVI